MREGAPKFKRKRECGGDERAMKAAKNVGSEATRRRKNFKKFLPKKGLAVAYHAERSPSRIILATVCHSGAIKVAHQAGKTLPLSPVTLGLFLIISLLLR
jgi:hypothetical protein